MRLPFARWLRRTRGEEEPARELAGKALELASTTSGVPAEQFATAALGLLELSLERNDETVEVLTPLVAFAREQEMREPGLTRFVPDLVEALVSLGRLDEAEDHLAWFEANAERLDRTSARGASARCRGLLAAARGDLAGALAAFECALAHHDAAPLPFDRARTLLALGAGRRRAKERRAARAALEEARSVFRSLGARIWEQRAAAELARIGGRAPSSGELTPVEQRVAELVGRGAHEQGSGGRAVPEHAHGRGSSLARLRQARRPLSRGARAQTRVVRPFFARRRLPSLEASRDDPDR